MPASLEAGAGRPLERIDGLLILRLRLLGPLLSGLLRGGAGNGRSQDRA
jgi:hypothetical protein